MPRPSLAQEVLWVGVGAQRRGKGDMEAGIAEEELPGQVTETPLPGITPRPHSSAPNCFLIAPRAGVEELAAALQAAVGRGGFQ